MTGGRRRRVARRASVVARVLVAAGVLHFLVLPQVGGTRKALTLLAAVDPRLVAGAVVLEVLSLAAYAQLSRSLLPMSSRPTLWTASRIVVSSLAVSHLVPGGAAAGGALQYRLLAREGVDSADASFAMVAQSMGSAVVLNLVLWISLLWSIPATGFNPLYALAAGFGATLLAGAAGMVVALTRGRRRTLEVVDRVAARVPKLDRGAVSGALERIADQVTALSGQPRRTAAVAGWATANWLLDVAVLWLFLAAFGHRAPLPGLLVAYGLANVLAAIPLSPGGLGIVETTLIVTLAGFGVPRAHASLGVSAYRLVQFWLPIPVGAAAWASLSGRRRRGAITDLVNEAASSAAPPAAGPAA